MLRVLQYSRTVSVRWALFNHNVLQYEAKRARNLCYNKPGVCAVGIGCTIVIKGEAGGINKKALAMSIG
jgi:hypothetical protein